MKRSFVIGDIHGCYDELLQLLAQAGVVAADELISVGDLVDRGNKSKEVWQFFRDRPNSIVLMGNHERKHMTGVINFAQEIVQSQMGADYGEFVRWVEALPYYHENEHAIIVHGGMDPAVSLAEQRDVVLCGSTAGERYLEGKYDQLWTAFYTGSKPVIYGHAVVGDTPQVVNNTWGIDTGACHGGYLTMIELPGMLVHQVKVTTDHWASERQRWQLEVLQNKDWEHMELVKIKAVLDGLRYKEEPAVQAYLAQRDAWVQELEAALPVLKVQLEKLATELIAVHGTGFNEIAKQHAYKSFLFKCRDGHLQMEDLKKSLSTPAKINEGRRTFAV